MQTAHAAPELINVVLTDWEQTRRAELDGVARDSTVAELVSEGARLLGLPPHALYQPLLRGRQLNRSDTLEDAGIESEDALELVPEVSAGR